MSKFKPGQKVVRNCEWSCSNKAWVGRPINKGEIHIIRETVIATNGEPCLLFEGINNPLTPTGREFCYNEREFSPLIEPTTGFVEVSFSRVIETEPKICAS